ncbi:MAG: cystathionine beta-lyase [Pseudomonadota bacterium]
MTKLPTRLGHIRGDRQTSETVNPPIERASTVLFDCPDALYNQKPAYGRMGLAVHRELEAGLADLEAAEHVRLTCNGLSACTLAIGALVTAGDHILFSDSLYGPTRRYCERRLQAMGVTASPFDPRIGAAIDDLITGTTKLIVMESPGSLTFEVHDTPAIVAVAKARDVLTVLDNTWGAGIHHKPLDLGVDVSTQALTKYVVGHADAFGGAVMTRDGQIAAQISACADDWGIALGPEEAYAALRGLRTLDVRLQRHEANGYEVAAWLARHPNVKAVLHPGREDHPDHALWKRDFAGANGLFGVVLRPQTEDAIKRMLGALNLIKMGFSWGGYETLLIPCDQQLKRVASPAPASPLLRIHVGLEAPTDLIADLDQAFSHLQPAT